MASKNMLSSKCVYILKQASGLRVQGGYVTRAGILVDPAYDTVWMKGAEFQVKAFYFLPGQGKIFLTIVGAVIDNDVTGTAKGVQS